MSSSFGGEHMSTAAVPSWIGSDCMLANCIPGSQAKSVQSELPQFFDTSISHIPPDLHVSFSTEPAAVRSGQNGT